MLVRVSLWLGLLLSLPILALFALDSLLWLRCTADVTGKGKLENGLEWRIERRKCTASKEPYFDVLIGLPGKTASPALLARGEPMPVNVIMVDGAPAVILSGPLAGSGPSDVIALKLRKSGSPATRIDLEKLKRESSRHGGEKS